MFKPLAAAALLLLTTFSHHAMAAGQALDGNELLAACNSVVRTMDEGPQPGDSFAMGQCIGLMQGIAALNTYYQAKEKNHALFCAPKGISNAQAVRVVVKYLQAHPETLDENESILAVKAMVHAFPCAGRH